MKHIPNKLTAETLRKSENNQELNKVGSADQSSSELDGGTTHGMWRIRETKKEEETQKGV
jgi:hypothetical protein